jgi:hypothetical protein
MRVYDFDLAKIITDKYAHDTEVEKIYLGIHEDWRSAITIYENGEAIKNIKEEAAEHRLRGSNWGTPVIQVNFKNGTQIVFNCFIEDGKNPIDILTKIKSMHDFSHGDFASLTPGGDENQINRESIEIQDFTTRPE